MGKTYKDDRKFEKHPQWKRLPRVPVMTRAEDAHTPRTKRAPKHKSKIVHKPEEW